LRLLTDYAPPPRLQHTPDLDGEVLAFIQGEGGTTTTLHAVAMALVLRAYLYCIYNFHFQQVEVPVLYLEQHCVKRSV
jgi:hypothetical protein